MPVHTLKAKLEKMEQRFAKTSVGRLFGFIGDDFSRPLTDAEKEVIAQGGYVYAGTQQKSTD